MKFNASPETTLGIELELQLLDAETLDLSDGILPLIEFYPAGHLVKPELIQSCVEINTPVCKNSEQARDYLSGTISELLERCDELGMKLCGAGTHPFGRQLALITPTPRYLRMKDEGGIIGRHQITFATHVHVGMPSGNAAMFVMRHLTPCLPLLLALSANSPFWRGHDTGYADYRHCILAASATYGSPQYFGDWDDFVRFLKAAQRSGMVQTLKDIHWDLRPNAEFGTLELRVMDAASSVGTTAQLAGLTRAVMVYLVNHISEDLAHWPFRRQTPWIEHVNRYKAAHHGLDAKFIIDEKGTTRPVKDLVRELLILIKPTATAVGELDAINTLETWLFNGAGYQRQKERLAQSRSLHSLTSDLVDELRVGIEESDLQSIA